MTLHSPTPIEQDQPVAVKTFRRNNRKLTAGEPAKRLEVMDWIENVIVPALVDRYLEELQPQFGVSLA